MRQFLVKLQNGWDLSVYSTSVDEAALDCRYLWRQSKITRLWHLEDLGEVVSVREVEGDQIP